jgi:hypothetical protein
VGRKNLAKAIKRGHVRAAARQDDDRITRALKSHFDLRATKSDYPTFQ